MRQNVSLKIIVLKGIRVGCRVCHGGESFAELFRTQVWRTTVVSQIHSGLHRDLPNGTAAIPIDVAAQQHTRKIVLRIASPPGSVSWMLSVEQSSTRRSLSLPLVGLERQA